MIKTSRQLKDLIRNMAQGDSGKAQLLLRNYVMERFLERVSLSKYKENFLLKGGMLVSSMVGLDRRATMDIDSDIRDLPLTTEYAKHMIEEIAAIEMEDNVSFSVKNVSTIMDEAEYSGVRLSLDAFLDTARIPLKIDLSTGDAIIPAEITYRYKLMFENRYIFLQAYPIEMVLAEKIETVLARTVFNTRLRDFYDLYILQNTGIEIHREILSSALKTICRKRNSERLLLGYRPILNEIEKNTTMQMLWANYQKKNNYAEKISWETVMSAIQYLCASCIG